MATDVAKDSLVGGWGPTSVVLRLQAVDRYDESEAAGATPLEGNGSHRAGHDLGVNSPPLQCRQEFRDFPPTDQWLPAHERQVKWTVKINQREDSSDQLLPFEIAELG
jgi:hypothetical protein